MAKKKKKAPAAPLLTPEQYIKQKARSLPVTECRINEEWQKYGSAMILVVRQHPNGKHTCASFWVDTFCLGVMDSHYFFSLDEDAYQDLINGFEEYIPISYNEVHNIIYGAIEYAEEAGIMPDASFKLTQYMLEEDTDDIPLIEYEFGRDGRHCLMAKNRLEASRYIPILEKHLGNNYDLFISGTDSDGEDFDDDDFDDDEFDDDDFDDDEFNNRELSDEELKERELEAEENRRFENYFSELMEDVNLDEVESDEDFEKCLDEVMADEERTQRIYDRHFGDLKKVEDGDWEEVDEADKTPDDDKLKDKDNHDEAENR
jgi:hypothetical protein